MSDRKWHKGSPLHVGWNASQSRFEDCWRWWSGKRWSIPVYERESGVVAAACAKQKAKNQKGIEWSDYWPINGRVPRINPETGEVTGRIK
jgi:hypothetical protein